jgi:hypothetical protein
MSEIRDGLSQGIRMKIIPVYNNGKLFGIKRRMSVVIYSNEGLSHDTGIKDPLRMKQ